MPRCGLDSDEYLMNGFDFLQPFCVISFKLEVMRRVGLFCSAFMAFVFGLLSLVSGEPRPRFEVTQVHSTKLKSIY